MGTSSYLTALYRVSFLILASQCVLAADADKRLNTRFYSVMDSKVDAATFKGYSTYRQTCLRCHGVAGESDIAPDLIQSVDYLSPESFRIKVLHKYAIKFSGDDWTNLQRSMFEEIRKQEQQNKNEIPNMPRWENNPMVTENVQNIYRYLKARADGVIGSARPGLLMD